MLVDSHCHLDCLDLKPFDDCFDNVLTAAGASDVQHFLCVSIDLQRWPAMLAQVSGYDSISVSVGIHPSADPKQITDVEQLSTLARHPKVVAIGETGLDYYYGKGREREQQDRFRTHIRAALAVRKPLIIHTRDAKQDTLDILRREKADQVGGVLHCFSEDWDMAQQAMAMNFYISFSGIVTFRNAGQLREVARRMPADRILIETDSPYLAPVPHRGKSNQPAWVRHVAERLAEIRDESFVSIAEITTRNYFRLFGDHRQATVNRA
jgi:TatD DNase family protein